MRNHATPPHEDAFGRFAAPKMHYHAARGSPAKKSFS
jgi:hypothetical protein